MIDENPFPNASVISLAQKYLSSQDFVLDIGCNRGQIGKILQERTNCHVTGLDKSQNLIKEASKVLDKTICADIEKDEIEGKYDMIILSNVLEHLEAPLEIILKLKKNLKKNGHILIAIPNIAFWQIRRDLLFGKFEYQKEGILNEEHLRFYTFRTFSNLLKEAGLEILETKTNYQGWRAFIASFWPTLLASQFVILCKKE